MVPPDSRRVPRVRRYLGCGLRAAAGFAYGAVTLFRRRSHAVPLPVRFVTRPGVQAPRKRRSRDPHAATPCRLHVRGFRLSRFRSPLLAGSRLTSFPRGTEMFQFPRLPPAPYVFGCGRRGIAPVGFSHSDIRGSEAVCASPRLFAACHVLLRLPMPRHPPCALSIFSSQCLSY